MLVAAKIAALVLFALFVILVLALKPRVVKALAGVSALIFLMIAGAMFYDPAVSLAGLAVAAVMSVAAFVFGAARLSRA